MTNKAAIHQRAGRWVLHLLLGDQHWVLRSLLGDQPALSNAEVTRLTSARCVNLLWFL